MGEMTRPYAATAHVLPPPSTCCLGAMLIGVSNVLAALFEL